MQIGILPDNTFFNPSDNFWDLLQSDWYHYRRVIDAGCGVGEVSRGLRDRGRDYVAIDLHQRREQGGSDIDIRIMNICEWYCEYGDLLIVARPNHSGWATEALVTAVRDRAEAIYVGLEKNISVDLDGLVIEKLREDVGGDGESAWRVLGRRSELSTYCLIQPEFWDEPHWQLRNDSTKMWENPLGGGFDIDMPRDTKILETRLLHSFDQIQVSSDTLCDPEELGGWIAPDGSFYGCKSRLHSEVVERVLGISEGRAERLGFVRCYGRYNESMLWVLGHGHIGHGHREQHLTRQQRRVLVSKGYDPRDHGELQDAEVTSLSI